jgi:four helix bundle protein
MKSYNDLDIKADFIRYLICSQSQCDETIIHLDFLNETRSFTDQVKYNQLKEDYDLLSKRINKLIQWVENNLNEFKSKPETSNL